MKVLLRLMGWVLLGAVFGFTGLAWAGSAWGDVQAAAETEPVAEPMENAPQWLSADQSRCPERLEGVWVGRDVMYHTPVFLHIREHITDQGMVYHFSSFKEGGVGTVLFLEHQNFIVMADGKIRGHQGEKAVSFAKNSAVAYGQMGASLGDKMSVSYVYRAFCKSGELHIEKQRQDTYLPAVGKSSDTVSLRFSVQPAPNTAYGRSLVWSADYESFDRHELRPLEPRFKKVVLSRGPNGCPVVEGMWFWGIRDQGSYVGQRLNLSLPAKNKNAWYGKRYALDLSNITRRWDLEVPVEDVRSGEPSLSFQFFPHNKEDQKIGLSYGTKQKARVSCQDGRLSIHSHGERGVTVGLSNMGATLSSTTAKMELDLWVAKEGDEPVLGFKHTYFGNLSNVVWAYGGESVSDSTAANAFGAGAVLDTSQQPPSLRSEKID